MSKGTEVPVLTTHHRVYRVTCRVGRAEFRFVLVRMVELLHAVVRIGAVVSIRTFLPRSYYLAQFGCVEMRQSTAILVAVVVVNTALRVMRVWRRTRSHFERTKVEMGDQVLIVAWIQDARVVDTIGRVVH